MSDARQSDEQRLQRLLRAGHTCILITTYEEEYALEVVRSVALPAGRDTLLWSVSGGVQNALLAGEGVVGDTAEPTKALRHFASRREQPLCITLDLVPHLSDPKVRRALRNLIVQLQRTGGQLIMIDHSDAVPDVIRHYTTQFEISLPSEAELERLTRDTLRAAHEQSPIQVDIKRSGWNTIIRNLRGLTRRQAKQIILDTIAEDRRFDEHDINTVLAKKRQALQGAGLLEYVEAPVSLDEIGGLRRLKQWLHTRQNAGTDEAAKFGVSAPRGVLMLGVQGAGKSLCAKALATGWHRPLLRMDVGALYDKYVGQTEKRLNDALRQAEMMAPIVLWIDEIEKAFASAAAQSTDGGLSKRMFGKLLTWMQEHTDPVFLVATANDIEALPPELMRKGRFDEIFFVDLPREDVRGQIFAIHLRKRGRDPEQFDLPALAQASDGFSGAEIEQAVVAALHDAFAKHCELTTDDILEVVRNSPPLSVTMAERVASLRDWARDRCVPAD